MYETPHTLALGDRVMSNGIDGVVVDNDGTGFLVKWDPKPPLKDVGGMGQVCMIPEDVSGAERFADGVSWPFTITHMEDIR